MNKSAVAQDDGFNDTLTSKFKLTKYRLNHIDLDEERAEILDKTAGSHSMFDAVLLSAVVKI